MRSTCGKNRKHFRTEILTPLKYSLGPAIFGWAREREGWHTGFATNVRIYFGTETSCRLESRKSFCFPIVGECARCAIWFARNITNARRELRMHSILFFKAALSLEIDMYTSRLQIRRCHLSSHFIVICHFLVEIWLVAEHEKILCKIKLLNNTSTKH